MSHKKPPLKKGRDAEKPTELPEVALAAVISYKKQKEVADFINFLLPALDRNSEWLNSIVVKQNNFKCALMVGAGPNRFTLQEIIYPSGDNEVKLEVDMKDNEDHDKIGIAALLKLTNSELDSLIKFLKTRMMDNEILREDLERGKALGVTYLVLRPMSENQYRVMERIVIGNSSKNLIPVKKRRREENILFGPPVKKTRKVV